MTESAAFMRSGKSNPLGSLTQPIPTFKVAEETYEGLRKLAAQAGMSIPEFVRRLIELRVHGASMIESLERQRNAVVLGKVGE